MKMIIASVLLLAILTILCIGSAIYVTNSVSQTASILEDALPQDTTTALSAVQAASARWDSCATIFGTVLRHDEIDSVAEDFARLENFARTKDWEEFLSTRAALLVKLHHIHEMELPSLKNIL